MSQYLLRFDGVNDRVEWGINQAFNTVNAIVEIDVVFNSFGAYQAVVANNNNNANSGATFLLGVAPSGEPYLQCGGNGLGGVRSVTGATPLNIGQRYTLRAEFSGLNPVTNSAQGVAELFVDGASIGTFTPDSRAFNDASLGISMLGARSADNNPASIDLYSFTFQTDTENRFYDPSASNGTGTTLFDTVGGNNGTLVNFTVPDCWVLIPSAGISVTGATANYSYAPIAAAVSLTGEITVTGATGSYSYTAVPGVVDLTGEIIVTGATPSYSYNSINGVVTLTPAASIVVTGQTATYSYTPVSGVIDLTPEIQITGNTASYSYTAQGASVLLQGTISVTGQTSMYSYTAVSAFVSLNALEPVVNFSGTIKRASFAGFLRNAQFSGTIKQSSFSGTRKAAQFSGVRK